MDAKMKAKFINSIPAEKELVCPKCGNANEADSKFCFSCGQLLEEDGENNQQADTSADASSVADLSSAEEDAEKEQPANEQTESLKEKSDGHGVTCPQCGNSNEPDSRFCFFCGNLLQKEAEEAAAPAQQPLIMSDAVPPTPLQTVPVAAIITHKTSSFPQENALDPITQEKTSVNEVAEKPTDAFAQGLPSWNLEPPQVVVRRKRHG